MWVLSLDWEDPLQEAMATHPSILAWRISWTEEPDGLWFIGYKELDTTERLNNNIVKFHPKIHLYTAEGP